MTAAKLEKLVPRVVLATPFRLFAVYVSLFCAAVAGTFIYANSEMQEFLNREAEASVKSDFDFLASRYRDGGLPSLTSAISERSPPSNVTLSLLTDGTGRWLAGNLETVAAGLWNTQGSAQFVYRRRG